MKFLADENIDAQLVAQLRNDGHDVVYIAELNPGINDDQVLTIANREGRLLLTEDKDFGELVFRMRRSSYGVILLRLAGLTSELKSDLLSQLIINHSDEISQAFTVLASQGARIRHQG